VEATKKHYLSYQYKIVDMAKPLLALRGAFESEGKLGILLGGLARISKNTNNNKIPKHIHIERTNQRTPHPTPTLFPRYLEERHTPKYVN